MKEPKPCNRLGLANNRRPVPGARDEAGRAVTGRYPGVLCAESVSRTLRTGSPGSVREANAGVAGPRPFNDQAPILCGLRACAEEDEQKCAEPRVRVIFPKTFRMKAQPWRCEKLDLREAQRQDSERNFIRSRR